MEVQNKILGPWLVFQHGKHERSQTFFHMATGSYHVRSIRQMRKKDVWLSSHGWLLLRDLSGRLCLFNPISLIEFEVPQLTKKHYDWICFLSAPPTYPNCHLILIPIKASICYSCKINEETKFSEVKFNCFDENDYFSDVICCKGRTYFLSHQGRFGEINVGDDNYFPTPRLLDVETPRAAGWKRTTYFLVESCGEVFLVYQTFEVTTNWILSFTVFKMDFSQMRWVHVKSIGDRLFFLSESCSQSCSALKAGLGGDQIFFFLPNDISLYSFHMKEGSISVYLTCPNLQPPWKTPFWVMETSNEGNVDVKWMRQSNVKINKVDRKRMQLITINEKVAKLKAAKETAIMKIAVDERPWSDLPIEIAMSIVRRLTPVAYARMRSICTSWRSITLPTWLPLTPCLIFHEETDGFFKFFDPLSKRVFAANIPELHGATFHFSKGGWLLVSFEDGSILFFNPFTKERINLPDLDYPFSSISFSSMPTSLDCIVFAIFNGGFFDDIWICTCSPGAQSWATYLRGEGVYPLFRVEATNPVFRNGVFYCLGQQGNRGVYNVIEDTWNVLKNPMPLQLPIGLCFLIESEGQLLFVYNRRTQIHVFTLDESKMVWVEVEVLEDSTLFLSRSTSLAMTVHKEATTGSIRDMKNKIYFSRFRRDSNDALFYHMESKSHHLDFYESKEFIKCTWIDTTGFEFGLDSRGNILTVASRLR
ncbi:Sec1-like protein [Cinnamomum micranthum f. kanehirae]|uniref:Sec1-like protein n=1 Tax=Cinnamomum micranthum f. kanehirae TaxID=337451 RepID=A0A443P4N7_9MAGN|nr:Sec1-like protein [Cinnamomum micranthum f. kanehirae]